MALPTHKKPKPIKRSIPPTLPAKERVARMKQWSAKMAKLLEEQLKNPPSAEEIAAADEAIREFFRETRFPEDYLRSH